MSVQIKVFLCLLFFSFLILIPGCELPFLSQPTTTPPITPTPETIAPQTIDIDCPEIQSTTAMAIYSPDYDANLMVFINFDEEIDETSSGCIFNPCNWKVSIPYPDGEVFGDVAKVVLEGKKIILFVNISHSESYPIQWRLSNLCAISDVYSNWCCGYSDITCDIIYPPSCPTSSTSCPLY